jgi:hypothetical protein
MDFSSFPRDCKNITMEQAHTELWMTLTQLTSAQRTAQLDNLLLKDLPEHMFKTYCEISRTE